MKRIVRIQLFNYVYNFRIEKTGKDCPPKWYSYFLCGVRGIYDHLSGDVKKYGIEVALSGNIPPASGLSSSSALVSAAVLATGHCQEVFKYPKI